MARSINKVILIGNLGGDPELRYPGGGTAVFNMSLATNEEYTDLEWGQGEDWRPIRYIERFRYDDKNQ